MALLFAWLWRAVHRDNRAAQFRRLCPAPSLGPLAHGRSVGFQLACGSGSLLACCLPCCGSRPAMCPGPEVAGGPSVQRCRSLSPRSGFSFALCARPDPGFRHSPCSPIRWSWCGCSPALNVISFAGFFTLAVYRDRHRRPRWAGGSAAPLTRPSAPSCAGSSPRWRSWRPPSLLPAPKALSIAVVALGLRLPRSCCRVTLAVTSLSRRDGGLVLPRLLVYRFAVRAPACRIHRRRRHAAQAALGSRAGDRRRHRGRGVGSSRSSPPRRCGRGCNAHSVRPPRSLRYPRRPLRRSGRPWPPHHPWQPGRPPCMKSCALLRRGTTCTVCCCRPHAARRRARRPPPLVGHLALEVVVPLLHAAWQAGRFHSSSRSEHPARTTAQPRPRAASRPRAAHRPSPPPHAAALTRDLQRSRESLRRCAGGGAAAHPPRPARWRTVHRTRGGIMFGLDAAHATLPWPPTHRPRPRH